MTLRKIFSFIFVMMLTTQAMQAQQQQQVAFGPLHSIDSPREDWILPGDTIYQSGKPMIYSGKPMKNPNPPQKMGMSPLHLGPNASAMDSNVSQIGSDASQVGDLISLSEPAPLDYLGLHKGLNMSVNLSAFATFGKNVPHRGGFTQTIDAAYLTPLTKDNKLWLALGAYVNNINYGGDNYHDGGVYGMLGYKINDHWDVYAYGQLSVANNYNTLYGRYAGYYSPYGYSPYGYWGYGMYPWGYGRGLMPGYGGTMGYGIGMPGANVLGAGVRYTNTSKTFSIGFNVEGVWYNTKTPTYYKQYDYPVY